MSDNNKEPRVGAINPIMIVTDMERSLAYYCDRLGFKSEFKWEDPVTYAILQCDDRQVHLSLHNEARPSLTYLFCHNVAALYEVIKGRGANITQEISTQPWEMIEFEVEDPDGNRLIYGESVEREGNKAE